jgi:hypothetical protein
MPQIAVINRGPRRSSDGKYRLFDVFEIFVG